MLMRLRTREEFEAKFGLRAMASGWAWFHDQNGEIGQCVAETVIGNQIGLLISEQKIDYNFGYKQTAYKLLFGDRIYIIERSMLTEQE